MTINWNNSNTDFEKFKEYVVVENFKNAYEKNGFIKVSNILNDEEIKIYSGLFLLTSLKIY